MGSILYHHPAASDCRGLGGGEAWIELLLLSSSLLSLLFDLGKDQGPPPPAPGTGSVPPPSSERGERARLITYLPSWWQNCIPHFPRSLGKHWRTRSPLSSARRRRFPSCGEGEEDEEEEEGAGTPRLRAGHGCCCACITSRMASRRMLGEREDEAGSLPPAPHSSHARSLPTHPPGTLQPISQIFFFLPLPPSFFPPSPKPEPLSAPRDALPLP